MSRNKIGILIVIFLLLGVYVYFYEIGKGEEKAKAPEKVKIIDVNPEDVQEIILKKDAQRVTLRRVEGQWRVEKPHNADVPNDKVHDLLSFFDYGIVRVIDNNPPDLKQYGLDMPRNEFWIKSEGNDAFQTLLIGGDAPGSLSCYAKVKGKSQVVLLGVRYRQELERALINFSKASDAKVLKDSPLLINRDSS